MKTPAVQAVCERIWDARARRELSASAAWRFGRELAQAEASDVAALPSYSPINDRRCQWARAVFAAVQAGRASLHVEAHLEATVEALLGKAIPCGRALAAGVEQEAN